MEGDTLAQQSLASSRVVHARVASPPVARPHWLFVERAGIFELQKFEKRNRFRRRVLIIICVLLDYLVFCDIVFFLISDVKLVQRYLIVSVTGSRLTFTGSLRFCKEVSWFFISFVSFRIFYFY